MALGNEISPSTPLNGCEIFALLDMKAGMCLELFQFIGCIRNVSGVSSMYNVIMQYLNSFCHAQSET